MRHMEDNRTVPFHSYNWSAFEKSYLRTTQNTIQNKNVNNCQIINRFYATLEMAVDREMVSTIL